MVDSLNNSSELTKVKQMAKNQLKRVYSHDIVDLLVDRRFSRLSLAYRYTTNGYLDEHQQGLILNEMLNGKMNYKEIIREFSLVMFLLLNLILAFVFNRKKFRKSRMDPSFIFSLTPEQIVNKGSTDLLGDFLREPRFQKIFYGKYLVVESKQVYRILGKNIYRNLEVVFDTSIWIAQNCMDRKTILSVIQESILRLIGVLQKGKKSHLQILREYVIDEPLWRRYTDQSRFVNPINLVTTQSHFLRLPYAFYIEEKDRVVRSMLWYSTNSIPIHNRRTQAIFDPDHFKLEKVDNHFVWTTEHKKFLIRHNSNAEVTVVGSIMFIPTQRAVKRNPIINTDIAIFDVTPYSGLGVEVIYSNEIMMDFIQDIVETVRSNEKTKYSRILLKPKRKISKKLRGGISSSIQYKNLISDLQQNNMIEVLRADINLYDLVRSVSLVVGIPFTSPVILAKELDVPCIYYVPESASDWIIGKSNDGVAVVNGRSEFESFIQGAWARKII